MDGEHGERGDHLGWRLPAESRKPIADLARQYAGCTGGGPDGSGCVAELGSGANPRRLLPDSSRADEPLPEAITCTGSSTYCSSAKGRAAPVAVREQRVRTVATCRTCRTAAIHAETKICNVLSR